MLFRSPVAPFGFLAPLLFKIAAKGAIPPTLRNSELVVTSASNNYICERTRCDAKIVLFLNNRQSVDQDLTPTKGRMVFDSFSLNACNLFSNCFVDKLLSNAYVGLAGPYRPYCFRRPCLYNLR